MLNSQKLQPTLLESGAGDVFQFLPVILVEQRVHLKQDGHLFADLADALDITAAAFGGPGRRFDLPGGDVMDLADPINNQADGGFPEVDHHHAGAAVVIAGRQVEAVAHVHHRDDSCPAG